MKVIDLLSKISNQEPVPNKILVDGKYFYWDDVEMFYQTEDKQDLLELGKYYSSWDFLNFTVIEDENKEIDIDSIEELTMGDIVNIDGMADERMKNKFNELIKAVKQLNKKIKEKE